MWQLYSGGGCILNDMNVVNVMGLWTGRKIIGGSPHINFCFQNPEDELFNFSESMVIIIVII